MERILRTVLIVTAALAAACAPRERTLVLLSTNDMHAKIRNFPRLAAAVEACRDTAQLVVLGMTWRRSVTTNSTTGRRFWAG